MAGPQQPKNTDNKQPNPENQIEGEGSYTAARDYKQSIDQFMQENADNIDDMARDAADSLNSEDEKDDLKDAEKEGLKHAKH